MNIKVLRDTAAFDSFFVESALADVPPPAIIASVLLVTTEPDKNVMDFPEVCVQACVVTRAMKWTHLVETSQCANVPWSVSYNELVSEQRADSPLKSLLDMVQPTGEVNNNSPVASV